MERHEVRRDPEDLRVDIAALRGLIDRLLDDGIASNDPLLIAAAQVLAQRKAWLQAALDHEHRRLFS